MDFFIPGINLSKLRAVAMRKQVGGVGFYPTSGSPFVHLDTGSVRAWPRMTRAQLKEIFPDGRTMHLPTDGKPLSQEGYQVAMAEWKTCHAYPCNGSSSGTQTASSGGTSLMDMFFGGNKGDPAPVPAPAPGAIQMASAAPVPVMPQVAAARELAPVPMLRPAALGGGSAPIAVASIEPVAIPFATSGSAPLDEAELTTAMAPPMPVLKSAALQQRTTGQSGEDAVTAIAALSAPMPMPRTIMSEQPPVGMTAYLPDLAQDPEAQKALDMLIQRETTASVAATVPPTQRQLILPPLTAATGLRTASLSGGPAVDAVASLFSSTFGASDQSTNAPMAAALADHIARRPVAVAMRQPELIAPDLEHIADVFLTPDAMTTAHFATIWDHDEADFDPTPELGRFVTVMAVGDVPRDLSMTQFVTN